MSEIHKKERLVGLDILRIFMAALILAFHSACHFQCNYGVIDGFVSMGAIAMTGFFILSGYTGYIANKDKDMNKIEKIRNYWIKRVIVIVPGYYVGALLNLLLMDNSETLAENFALAPIELLGIQNIYPNTFTLTHNGGSWFISCILICYVFFPFICEVTKQICFKTKMIIMIVLSGVLLYSPLMTHIIKIIGSIYDNPFLRLFEFIIGVLLASMMEELKKIKFFHTKTCVLLITMIMIVVVELAYRLEVARGNFLLYSWIALPAFVLIIVSLSLIKFKEYKVVKYLSSISYAFFVVQLFIWPIMRKLVSITGLDNNIFRILLSFVVCTIFAVLIYEIVEKPINKILTKKLLNQI